MGRDQLHSVEGPVQSGHLSTPTLCVLAVLLLGLATEGAFSSASGAGPQEGDIEVFVREGCPHCEAAKGFLKGLQAERPTLKITLRDVGKDPTAWVRLQTLALQLGVPTVGVPAFYLRGELLVGYGSPDTTGARLKALLDQPGPATREALPEGACPPTAPEPCGPSRPGPVLEPESVLVPFFGRLNAQEMGLPLFTIALGLLDGFNPCAMWALLFLLSLLVNLRDRIKMALVAGTFVAVSGAVYFAFMAAWLNIFLLIGFSRATQILLGGIAVLIGIVHVKDFFAFGHGPSLSIPETVKPGLYVQMRRILQAENLAGALVAVAGLAVVVNMIEFLCTAGIPAVYTRILTLRDLPWWEYYAYLGLYNLAYVLDDGLMVAAAVVTLSQRKLQEKGGRWLKLISGLVMVELGGLLIIKPEWLTG